MITNYTDITDVASICFEPEGLPTDENMNRLEHTFANASADAADRAFQVMCEKEQVPEFVAGMFPVPSTDVDVADRQALMATLVDKLSATNVARLDHVIQNHAGLNDRQKSEFARMLFERGEPWKVDDVVVKLWNWGDSQTLQEGSRLFSLAQQLYRPDKANTLEAPELSARSELLLQAHRKVPIDGVLLLNTAIQRVTNLQDAERLEINSLAKTSGGDAHAEAFDGKFWEFMSKPPAAQAYGDGLRNRTRVGMEQSDVFKEPPAPVPAGGTWVTAKNLPHVDLLNDGRHKPGTAAAAETATPADKPVDKPADEPVDKPADKPTDKPTDKPADKPAETPVAAKRDAAAVGALNLKNRVEAQLAEKQGLTYREWARTKVQVKEFHEDAATGDIKVTVGPRTRLWYLAGAYMNRPGDFTHITNADGSKITRQIREGDTLLISGSARARNLTAGVAPKESSAAPVELVESSANPEPLETPPPRATSQEPPPLKAGGRPSTGALPVTRPSNARGEDNMRWLDEMLDLAPVPSSETTAP